MKARHPSGNLGPATLSHSEADLLDHPGEQFSLHGLAGIASGDLSTGNEARAAPGCVISPTTLQAEMAFCIRPT